MTSNNQKIEEFKKLYPLDENLLSRVPNPKFKYLGEDILNKAIAAIISGKNILLVGDKSTGKNVLAENLAYIFNRPMWNVSFHINVDSSSLIGDDSLKDSNVYFRKGPITLAAENGGFAVLDEINMAKNEAMAVLHSVLDYRRQIDIPGIKLVNLHPATRFIATMNYGYEGTRDLNEALLSRFVIIRMPKISDENLRTLILSHFPEISPKYIENLAGLFNDIRLKSEANEISNDACDLRGLFDGLDLVKNGISLKDGLEITIANKIFDEYERDLVLDLMKARFNQDTFYEDMING